MTPNSPIKQRFILFLTVCLLLSQVPPAFSLRPETDKSGLEEALGNWRPPEHSFFQAVQERQARVRQLAVLARERGKDLGLTPEEVDALDKIRQVKEAEVEWELDDGTVQDVQVVWVKDTFTPGKRPSKGGIRFTLHPSVLGEASLKIWEEYQTRHAPDESQSRFLLGKLAAQAAIALAQLMSWKLALVELDEFLGGGKADFLGLDLAREGDVFKIVPFKPKLSRSELERLSFKGGTVLADAGAVGPEEYVPATDVGATDWMMALMLEAFLRVQVRDPESSLRRDHPDLARHLTELLDNPPAEVTMVKAVLDYEKKTGRVVREKAAYTGKPIDLGGSLGRSDATGKGGLIVTEEMVRRIFPERRAMERPLEGMRVAIQGFGNVGEPTARLFTQAGAVVQAVSDVSGYLQMADGFKPADWDALSASKKAGNLLKDYPQGALSGIATFHPGPQGMLELPVDILVPAAIEMAITEENAPRIQARMVVPLANGGVTPQASAFLAKQGTAVAPDTLVNAGGVTVSWFEMLQNFEGRQWPLEVVEQKLREQLIGPVDRLWEEWEWLRENLDPEIDLMTAADLVSIRRLVERFVRTPAAVTVESAPHKGVEDPIFWGNWVRDVLDSSTSTREEKVEILGKAWVEDRHGTLTLNSEMLALGEAHEAADLAFWRAIKDDRLGYEVILWILRSPSLARRRLAADGIAHYGEFATRKNRFGIPLDLVLGFYGADHPDLVEWGFLEHQSIGWRVPWTWIEGLLEGESPEEVLSSAMKEAGYSKFGVHRMADGDFILTFVPKRATAPTAGLEDANATAIAEPVVEGTDWDALGGILGSVSPAQPGTDGRFRDLDSPSLKDVLSRWPEVKEVLGAMALKVDRESPIDEEMGRVRDAIARLVKRIDDLRFDPRAVLSSPIFKEIEQGRPPVPVGSILMKGEALSSSPETFRWLLEDLDGFLAWLPFRSEQDKKQVFEKLSAQELKEVLFEAIQRTTQGEGYRIHMQPEKGTYKFTAVHQDSEEAEERPLEVDGYRREYLHGIWVESGLVALRDLISGQSGAVKEIADSRTKVALLVDPQLTTASADDLSEITALLWQLAKYPTVELAFSSEKREEDYRAKGFQVVRMLPESAVPSNGQVPADPDAIYVKPSSPSRLLSREQLVSVATEALALWQQERKKGPGLHSPIVLDITPYLDIRGLTLKAIWEKVLVEYFL